MAIELKQSLKLSQQLLITPQLQQAIKLLQLSRMELVETVQKELLENPVLEEDDTKNHPDDEPRQANSDTIGDQSPSNNDEPGDPRTDDNAPEAKTENENEFDWSNYIESSNQSSKEPRSFAGNPDEEAPNFENMLSSSTSLHDHLEWQVKMGSLSKEEEDASITIIGNLCDNGYLQSSLEDLADRTPYSLDELDDALCLIQELDPPGVGARDLRECLLLQIKDSGTDRTSLESIIKNHLPLLEKRDYPTLSKKLDLNLKRTRELADTIFALEPKPGRSFGRNEAQYITPDVHVQKVGGEFVVVLNEDGLPKLQISNLYKTAIMKEMADRNKAPEKEDSSNSKDKEAQNYIQDKLKSALWLIKSIHQRQKTLYKVTKSIVKFQTEFLDKGVQRLKPLVLRDVADEIGVHESTVSRATNGKYVHTPQGIYELKYFFNTGISNSTGGQDFANEAVKQMIKQLIGNEDIKSPLSDQALATLLKRQNINIARRTVAKYREMMGILPSSRRKRLY